MKFENISEMIQNPAAGAYYEQIKALRLNLAKAPMESKPEINRQILELTKKMNEIKRNKKKFDNDDMSIKGDKTNEPRR